MLVRVRVYDDLLWRLFIKIRAGSRFKISTARTFLTKRVAFTI